MALLRWQQNIVDDAGNVQSGASVEIRSETTGALVSLFADRAGTTSKGNPITADANGYAFAYTESDRFKITATNGAFSAEWRDVRLPEDAATIAADAVTEHVGEADPHTQYAQLAGGADADFTAMPQVGGAPIVESGSNTDGEWTRWADGTQICFAEEAASVDVNSATGSVFRSTSAVTWTFPAVFTGAIPCAGVGRIQSSGRWGAVASTSLQAAAINAFSSTASDVALAVPASALGRWK